MGLAGKERVGVIFRKDGVEAAFDPQVIDFKGFTTVSKDTDGVLTLERGVLAHSHPISDIVNLQTVLDGVTGQLATKLSGISFFGDGSDGDVAVNVNTNLTRDMCYNNLTVPVGVTLNPSGFRIFVRGTLTLHGKIADNGVNGSDGANGGGAGPATKGVGGAGGNATPNKVDVSVGRHDVNSLMGSAGGAGGNGGKYAQARQLGGNGGAGLQSLDAIQGASGGLSGRGSSPWGVGGDGGGLSLLAPNFGSMRNALNMMMQRAWNPASTVKTFHGHAHNGGGGGAPGGAVDVIISADPNVAGGGGGGGGAAGQNGGTVIICARIISGTGSIEANAGDGGQGGDGGNGYQEPQRDDFGQGGYGGYGGDGGNGGMIVLMYHSWAQVTVVATSGVGGAFGIGGMGRYGRITVPPDYEVYDGGRGPSGNVGFPGFAGILIYLQV